MQRRDTWTPQGFVPDHGYVSGTYAATGGYTAVSGSSSSLASVRPEEQLLVTQLSSPPASPNVSPVQVRRKSSSAIAPAPVTEEESEEPELIGRQVFEA